jgi:hypothetical protein
MHGSSIQHVDYNLLYLKNQKLFQCYNLLTFILFLAGLNNCGQKKSKNEQEFGGAMLEEKN